MGIKQHFVALAGIRHQPKGPTRAQLQVRHLDAPIQAANYQALLTPVKLKGLAQRKLERHKARLRLAGTLLPAANECRDLTIRAVITFCLNLFE